MNSEAAELLRDVAADVEAKGGPAAHRAHALQHLRLKTVIKVAACVETRQLLDIPT